ncbi:MAG: squalene/phytoene synthase family protein [Candidatus Diapherotrites archaeon]|nr:squalene/phytoene synthase family protein [Candidatus Diapherotrites archaeon]
MLSGNSKKLLSLVSRSFALCIPRLPEQVRGEVGNFYLLCRYADSIEDSSMNKSQKANAFKKFYSSIKKNDSIQLNELNKEIFPFIINANDKKMIKKFQLVMKEFSGFDFKSKRIALRWVKEMMKGMNKYSKKEIESFLELDNYCYYVAGTVGNYLTEIFDHKFDLKMYPALKKRAKHFGLLLQKVNIIRDFTKDSIEGRIFWPKKLFQKHGLNSFEDMFLPENKSKRKAILKEMVESALKNLKAAIEYIESLPIELTGLRVFCAIPLGMAVPTLNKCIQEEDKLFTKNEKVKLSRTETMQILNSINREINSNEFIKNKLVPKVMV